LGFNDAGEDTQIREEIFKRKGMKKGNLTKVIEEAIEIWLKEKAKD
jgi:hypothetical protein